MRVIIKLLTFLTLNFLNEMLLRWLNSFSISFLQFHLYVLYTHKPKINVVLKVLLHYVCFDSFLLHTQKIEGLRKISFSFLNCCFIIFIFVVLVELITTCKILGIPWRRELVYYTFNAVYRYIPDTITVCYEVITFWYVSFGNKWKTFLF